MISATRHELMRLNKKKKTARRGQKLLKDKRDSLMQTFMAMISKTILLRKKVDREMLVILREFKLADQEMDPNYLETLASTPSASISIVRRMTNVMSVKIPILEAKIEGNFFNYGLLQTDVHLDKALQRLQKLLPDLLKLVQEEFAAQLLSAEIEKTRRRVNALDYIIIPQVQFQISFIRNKLEEQARQNLVSLIKMKERMTA